LLIYPSQKLQYYGITSNQNSVKSLLTPEELSNIEIHQIVYTKPYNEKTFFKAINFVRKEFARQKMFKNILKNTTNDDLVFLSITTHFSFYGFKKLKTKYPVKTIAALHGDIDFIYNIAGLQEKINSIVHKKLFKIKAENFYYLALNKIAKAIMVKDGYLKESETMEINLPIHSLNNQTNNNEILPNEKVIIGHIGSMELVRKNSHLLYEVANKFQDEINAKQLSFETIGLITPSILPYKNKWVTEIVGNSRPEKPDYLTREEYETNVLRLHYAVYFYDQKQYVFRASAAVIDSITFEIPIIAFEHPFFNNLFSQAGPIGYLCKDIAEVETVIKKIVSKDEKTIADYAIFKQNLSKLRTIFSVNSVAGDLQKQINEKIK
jgi:hypothetical protein